jgi:hypothetical protein
MTNSGFKYYDYDPSLAAAVLFMALFVLTTALHIYQLLRTRTWYFIPFVIGGFRKSTTLRFTSLLDNHQMLNVVLAVEWIGYVGRIVGSEQTPNWTLPPYIVQVLFLLLAPVLFAASIYMELARIILLADGEAHALIRPKRLTMTFVLGDVFSFLLQCGGTLIQPTDRALMMMQYTNCSYRRRTYVHWLPRQVPNYRQNRPEGRRRGPIAPNPLFRLLRFRRGPLPAPHPQSTHPTIPVGSHPMAQTSRRPLRCQHPHLDPVCVQSCGVYPGK